MLAACSSEEPTKFPNKDLITNQEGGNTTDTSTNDEEKPNSDISEETNKNENNKTEDNNNENNVIDNEENKTDDTTSNTSNNGTIAFAEEIPENAPAFSETFKVSGYSMMSFMGNLSFNITVTPIHENDIGSIDFDVSKANLPDNITDYFDYLYIKVEFDGKEIVSWDVFDKETNISIFDMTEDEMVMKYTPEVKFDIVDAGALPETMKLSEYTFGKTYVFTTEKDAGFTPPTIINDTEYSIVAIATKIGINDEFDREYRANQGMPDNTGRGASSQEGKYYVAVIGPDDRFMDSDDCHRLAGYSVGDKLDFSFEDFVGNNTDKTITVSVSSFGEDAEFTIAPGNIIYCSWMNDVTIKEIK
jgi:hypothetical protein